MVAKKRSVTKAGRLASADSRKILVAPWLRGVSNDGSHWTVTGGAGYRQDTAEIEFNIGLPNGTKLADQENTHFYLAAQSYAETIRFYMPELSAQVHCERVKALLAFIYWLVLHGVTSFSEVTEDHITLFQEQSALGREWALQGPHQLLQYLVDLRAKPAPVSMAGKRDKAAIHEIRLRAGIAKFVPWGRLSKAVLKYSREHSTQSSWPELDVILNYEKSVPTKITIQALHRSLLPIEEIWLWRDHLPKPHLRMNPFLRGSMSVANALGVEADRTPTIPPKMAFAYLAGAVKWVLEYGPTILDAQNGKIELATLEQRLGALGLRWSFAEERVGSRDPVSVSGYSGLVAILSSACLATIAGLSAQRIDAIYDLGAGCIKDDEAAANHWLVIHVDKTSRRYDQIPVPRIVARAVECLEKLSESAREATNTDGVWQWRNPKTGAIKGLTPERYLDTLAALNGITIPGQEPWHFTPHQFRRFFALVYFWRYEKGDLAALAHHLRHFDLEMTRRYVTDADFNKLWREAETEYKESFLRTVVYGSRSIGGKAGSRLLKEAGKLIALYRKHVDVVPVDRVVAKLMRLADRWGSEFRQHVWGTICACPKRTGLAELARCKGARTTGPDFANAGEEACSQCPFAIHTEQFGEAVKARLDEQRNNRRSCKQGSLLSNLTRMNIHALEDDLNHGIPPLDRLDIPS